MTERLHIPIGGSGDAKGPATELIVTAPVGSAEVETDVVSVKDEEGYETTNIDFVGQHTFRTSPLLDPDSRGQVTVASNDVSVGVRAVDGSWVQEVEVEPTRTRLKLAPGSHLSIVDSSFNEVFRVDEADGKIHVKSGVPIVADL